MSPDEEHQRLSRYLDRIERLLKKSVETYGQQRKKERAETRALKEKLRNLYRSEPSTGMGEDEPKH